MSKSFAFDYDPDRGHEAVDRPRQNEGKGQKSVKTRAPLASYRSGGWGQTTPMFPTGSPPQW